MRFQGPNGRFFGMAAIFAGTLMGAVLWPKAREGWRDFLQERARSERETAAVNLEPTQTPQRPVVRVLAYNLQNLFDTVDDPWKDDEEFLPRRVKRELSFAKTCGKQTRETCRTRNWTPEALELKLSRIAGALDGEGWRKDEVLLLSEVENAAVLRRLLEKYRPRVWRTVALVEGDDNRGIDVAVASTFPLKTAPHLHSVGPRTRGILEARLDVGCGKEWTIFSFHFPSQLGSTKARRHALDRLLGLIRAAEHSGDRVIAGGDSNMTMEDQHAWHLEERAGVNGGAITHFHGCAGCRGTYWYRDRWDFLDWMYFSGELISSSVRRESIRVLDDGPLQTDQNGRPRRFTEYNGFGVSDHFPIAADVELRECAEELAPSRKPHLAK